MKRYEVYYQNKEVVQKIDTLYDTEAVNHLIRWILKGPFDKVLVLSHDETPASINAFDTAYEFDKSALEGGHPTELNSEDEPAYAEE